MHGLNWHTPATGQPVTGVALLIHGLNLQPSRMNVIVEHLTHAGIQVLACALRGHGDNFDLQPGLSDTAARLDALCAVTYAQWRTETAAAYARARERAAALGDVRVFLAGFSLGCLMGCTLFATDPSVHFDRMLFFAPALRIRRHGYLPRLLSAFPRFVIPSLAPQAYRANRGSSVAAYCALYAALDDFSRHLNKRLNVPTLIFCDPMDELVSYRRLQQLITDAQLTRWTLCPVFKEGPAHGQYHHLVIDPASVGEKMWANMMELAIQHLGSERSAST